ncbi:hypothetical protein [Rossellomorea yichunensis]|jgi:hypothetical protein|uniref:hypothetical protein n=1 Tax=Rossellomorea yichunensis TaxID=3077331 RepID=UPI0028E07590|nr:hypothetical protein [Rossellomorea sp. YC4-1]MDT9025808.1 hypothetical protein [Rossellomorea sp. YC4-1]
MNIIHRRYNRIQYYGRIRTQLEQEYETYGTKFDHNFTLFEFQSALSSGLGGL